MVPSIMTYGPGYEAAKHFQNITAAHKFDCWCDVLFLKCFVSSAPDKTGIKSSK